MTRRPDEGVVLINVLVVLGLAASIVYAMLTLADLSIARSQRFREAGQGLALIRAGEQSAIAALRRDMIEASDIDHAGEGWSEAGQEAIAIAGGSFELTIEDAQGLLNLNALVGGGLQGAEVLQAIGETAGLPAETAPRIIASLTRDGPLDRMSDLVARVGIPPEELLALGRLATVLPGQGDVNINAAPLELLAVLLQNPVQARGLIARRDRAGFLTPEDVDAARVILPVGIGYRSDLFRVRATVRIGDTEQSMASLLRRHEGPDGPLVEVIARTNAMAAVFPPPPSS